MSVSTSGEGKAAAPDAAGPAETPGLRRLRRLVTGLTATLIVGMITVVGLLVIRLAELGPSAPASSASGSGSVSGLAAGATLPEALALPAGETARAATFGTGWVAVVTADAAGTERIRVFDAATGAPRGEIAIAPR